MIAGLTPLHETTLQGAGYLSYIVSFHQTSNPIPFTLNASAPGDSIGTLTVTTQAAAPVGTVAALTLHPASAVLSNQTGITIETVASGGLSLVNGSVTISASTVPTALVATANGTTQVALTWTGAAGADHYEVFRSANGAAYTFLANAPGTTHPDNTVSGGTTYLYRVRSVDGGGGTSAFSNIDAATTIVFTNDPLVAQSTLVRLVHITQLRTAVNAMRAAASLPPLPADGTIAAGAVVRAQHIANLRTGLAAARSTIGLPALTFTDPTLTAQSTRIKAVHVQELRNGVK